MLKFIRGHSAQSSTSSKLSTSSSSSDASDKPNNETDVKVSYHLLHRSRHRCQLHNLIYIYLAITVLTNSCSYRLDSQIPDETQQFQLRRSNGQDHLRSQTVS